MIRSFHLHIQCGVAVMAMLLCSHAPAQIKHAIDEELLSELVMAKQEEIKQRAIRDLVRPSLKGSSIASYNTVLDLVDVLLKEKNKSAMTRDLVRIVGEHTVAYAATWYFIRFECPECSSLPMPRNGKWYTEGEDPWRKLVGSYRQHQRTTNAGAYTRTRICGQVPYEISLFNYLLDTISIQFRTDDDRLGRWLKKTGLFTRSAQRDWQGQAQRKYADIWDGDSTLNRAVHDGLAAFFQKLGMPELQWEEILGAVSRSQAARLAQLDLRSLTGAQQWNAGLGEKVLVNDQVAALFELFRKSIELYRHDTGKNRLIARFSDLLDKYIILDPEKTDPLSRFGFSIDVEAVILSLEDRLAEGAASPTKNSLFNLRPYFTIGLNYGAHRTPFTGFADTTNAGLRTVAWAGEKLGLKWRIADFKYARNQPVGEYFLYHGKNYKRLVRPKDPYISNVYMNLFASGLLYTIADLRSDSDFRNPVIGLGAGVTWFNGLETNIGYVAPIINGATIGEDFDAGFFNLALDIPLFEYIKAARQKRGK